MIDVQAMSQAEGISEAAIRKALGMPNVLATLEQVRSAYNCAPAGSEDQKLAMAKWREFSAQEIAAATTLEQARKAYENAPNDSEEQELALIKLASFYEK